MREFWFRAAASAALALVGSVAMAQWYVTTVPLGNFGGAELTFGGISPDGNVLLGGAYLNPNGRQAALLWSQATGYRYFEEEPRSILSTASTIAGGVVVGYGTTRGFSWTSGTGALWLIDLPGGTLSSQALDISGDGSLTVGWSSSYYSPSGEAVYWQNGVPTGFGALLGPQGTWSVATDISLDGEIMIGMCTAGPFKYSRTSGPTMLPLLPGSVSGTVAAISRDGSVIVGTCTNASNYSQACIWRDGTVIGLGGYSEDGLTGTSAFDVSGDGAIVIGGGTGKGFIWTEGLGMYEIASYMRQHGVQHSFFGIYGLQLSDDGHTLGSVAQDGIFQPMVFTKFGIGNTEVVARISGSVTFSDLSEGAVRPSKIKMDIRSLQDDSIVRWRWVELGPQGEFDLYGPAIPGPYSITTKYGHWLRRRVFINTVGGDVNNVSVILTNGDIDHDNEIGIGDYAELSATYGAVPGDFNWYAECDLNGDEGIDIGDYAILSANYGEVGD